jgi:hypothetical protein
VAHVVQRDMMAMPLAPRGRTPFSSDLDRLSSGHGDVICGTGDSLVTSSDPWLNENNIDIVDMELFAIAHVCQRHSVRWRALKFITDDANDFAAEHWTANVADGQELFWDAEEVDVGSRPSIVRLWRILSTSSTRCLYRTGRSFRPSWMHSCGRRQVRGYRGESVKPSIRDFQARSDVKLRPAEYAGEVTEAGSLPGEQSPREGERR